MTIRIWKDRGCEIEFYPKTASETFTFEDLVYISTAGRLTKNTTSGTSAPILGQIYKTIATTDSDYADTTRVPVLVCGPDAEFLCDVSTGTAAQTDVGEYIDIDDENSVDVNATSNNEFYVTGFLSGTNQVIAKIVRKLPNVHE